jgi:phospholipase C
MNPNISTWRRQVCGDLTSAFDFAHPNTNFPSIAGVAELDCPDGITPAVPSPQTFPSQESGARIPMPLPYQSNARCALNTSGNSFALIMTNWGAASVHFGVYANAYRTDGPWPFDVNTTNSASMSFSTAGLYDFSCYGPNGFQRRFAGNITADFQKIEAASLLNPVNGGIKIELDNATASTVTFTITNGYTSGSVAYPVSAHTTNLVNVGSETNNGFYDVTVTASADSAFLRRFLGRVETYVAPFVSGGDLLPDGTFQFSFSAPAGQPYRILATTNLLDPASWVAILSGTFGPQPVLFTESNMSSRPARFYRLASP